MWRDNFILSFLTWILYLNKCVDATCTQPSSEWTGKWWDSQFDGDTTLTYSAGVIQVSGWSITAYTSTVSSWSCVNEDTTNNYILFKGDTTVDLYGVDQSAYLCVAWTKITDQSFIYYLRAESEVNANNHRVYIEEASIATGAVSKYCNPTNAPSSTEFHTLVKQGIDYLSVSQYFEVPFLGKFYYTANDGTTDTCGTTSNWDMCTNRTTMVFNYTMCNTKMGFSDGGVLYGIHTITSGSNYFLSAINNDSTVDSSTYYRFTCFVFKTSGSNVVSSFNHGSCSSSYDPDTVPTGGLKATMTATVTCPFTTDSGASTGGSSIGLIVGAVVGVMLIIAIIIAVYCICKKMKEKQNRVQSATKKQVPPQGKYISNGDILESMSPRDALDITPKGDEKLKPLDHQLAVPGEAVGKKPLPPIT